MIKKLVDSERNQRKMKEDLTELREKCHQFEAERNKLLNTVDKLKLKCKKLDTEATNLIGTHGKEPCSLFCSCENETSRKPQRLQKCCSFKGGRKTDVECETTVFSSEVHSAKLNYHYEGDKQNNQDIVGQSKDFKFSSAVSSPSIINNSSDNTYSSNSVVLTDDGVHKLCITTTDGIKTKVLKDKKSKEQHTKLMARKVDENNRNTTKDYSQLNEERNTSSKTTGNLVQAYV